MRSWPTPATSVRRRQWRAKNYSAVWPIAVPAFARSMEITMCAAHKGRTRQRTIAWRRRVGFDVTGLPRPACATVVAIARPTPVLLRVSAQAARPPSNRVRRKCRARTAFDETSSRVPARGSMATCASRSDTGCWCTARRAILSRTKHWRSGSKRLTSKFIFNATMHVAATRRHATRRVEASRHATRFVLNENLKLLTQSLQRRRRIRCRFRHKFAR